MNVLLLTKQSVMQAYCANKLVKKNILTNVIIEREEKKLNFFFLFLKRLFKFFYFLHNPYKLIFRLKFFTSFDKFFGNQEFHNNRILKTNSNVFSNKLKINFINSVSDIEIINIIKKINPDIIFVFGTKMIPKKIINQINCPMINQHAGWSPKYRGEGIVSAISNKDFESIGVTVHYIDEKSDSGEIIYQEKIELDNYDNFYSIHLKIIKKGTDLFEKVLLDFKNNDIKSRQQDLLRGKIYGKKYFINNPQTYDIAWKNLIQKRDEL